MPSIAVVSNPEFLQEGTAVRNFMNPDRIVVGSTDRAAALAVAGLYKKFGAPTVVTSPESSELIKYASNAFLAMKLSFINSIGALAETVGADVAEIAGGMGFDERIGPKFLRTGPGWGGSCFPKDTRALAMIAADNDVSFPLLEATTVSNDEAQDRVADKVRLAAGGSLDGVQVALWGLTFKAGTDDLRDSPALAVASRLAAEGAQLRGFDPAISADIRAAKDRPNISVAPDAYSAAAGAAVLVVLTEWPEFRELDLLKTGGRDDRPHDHRQPQHHRSGTGRGGRIPTGATRPACLLTPDAAPAATGPDYGFGVLSGTQPVNFEVPVTTVAVSLTPTAAAAGVVDVGVVTAATPLVAGAWALFVWPAVVPVGRTGSAVVTTTAAADAAVIWTDVEVSVGRVAVGDVPDC